MSRRYLGTHDFSNATVLGLGSSSGVATSTISASGATIEGEQTFVGLSGTPEVNLPSAPLDGEFHYLKDVQGIASTSGIQVNGNGANIDGSGSYTISNDYESISVVYLQAFGEWFLF